MKPTTFAEEIRKTLEEHYNWNLDVATGDILSLIQTTIRESLGERKEHGQWCAKFEVSPEGDSDSCDCGADDYNEARDTITSNLQAKGLL